MGANALFQPGRHQAVLVRGPAESFGFDVQLGSVAQRGNGGGQHAEQAGPEGDPRPQHRVLGEQRLHAKHKEEEYEARQAKSL